MCWNSSFACWNFGAFRRRGRANTGGPLVVMWWVILCLITGSRKFGWVRLGKRFNSALYSSWMLRGKWTGLITGPEAWKPRITWLVTASIRRWFFRSSKRLKCRRKSAPSIAFGMSAIVNIQGKERRSPTLSVNDFCPYVLITVLLAAVRTTFWLIRVFSFGVGGITLISAPESTRKIWLVLRSLRKRRRQDDELPHSVVASTERRESFPKMWFVS